MTLGVGILGSGYMGRTYAFGLKEINHDARLVAVGGASVAPGTLPPGLTLELLPGQVDTVRISGTPTTAGTSEFTVSVWCFGTNVSGQTGEQRYAITVS